ncbi:MBL fold metallo-hydrolase [Solibacillus silvestris]
MLDIKLLASGSKGNCYCLDDGTSRILLECGITFKEIQKGLNFETSKLTGCLVTHSHQDHCKGAKTLLERGINIHTSKGTIEEMGMKNYRLKAVERDATKGDGTMFKQFRIGSWTILPFDAMHDTAEPVNFLLLSDHGYKVLFVTDSYYVKYNFAGITHYLVECNFDQQTIDENISNGKLHPAQRKRVMKSHMSLETLTDFFKSNDLSKCEEIYLLHLSERNANRERIFNEVAKVTGKQITIVG